MKPPEILVMKDCPECELGWRPTSLRREKVRCIACNGTARVQARVSVAELYALLFPHAAPPGAP